MSSFFLFLFVSVINPLSFGSSLIVNAATCASAASTASSAGCRACSRLPCRVSSAAVSTGLAAVVPRVTQLASFCYVVATCTLVHSMTRNYFAGIPQKIKYKDKRQDVTTVTRLLLCHNIKQSQGRYHSAKYVLQWFGGTHN